MINEILGEFSGLLKSTWWLAWLIAALMVIYAFAVGTAQFTVAVRTIYRSIEDLRAKLRRQRLSDTELRSRAREVAKGILDLIGSRRAGEPPFGFERFHESVQAQAKYSSETLRLYQTRFMPEVIQLRQEFLKRKLSEPELDRQYENPINYWGYQAVAVSLLNLAEKLSK